MGFLTQISSLRQYILGLPKCMSLETRIIYNIILRVQDLHIYLINQFFIASLNLLNLINNDNYFTSFFFHFSAIQCPPPLPPKNGRLLDSGHYLVGNTVQYFCKEGFVLIGEPVIRCTESGLWSHAPPFCKLSNDFIKISLILLRQIKNIKDYGTLAMYIISFIKYY